jgi:hypothetical protein
MYTGHNGIVCNTAVNINPITEGLPIICKNMCNDIKNVTASRDHLTDPLYVVECDRGGLVFLQERMVREKEERIMYARRLYRV